MNLRYIATKVLRAVITLWMAVTFIFVILSISGDSPDTPPAGSDRLLPAAAPGEGGRMAARWRQRVSGNVLVIAHRGYSAAYADNSLEAFDAAIAAGADLIETDVRLSRDKVLVCVHDPDIDFFTDVDDLSGEELAKHSIIRLAQVLQMARGRVGVLLDVKLEDEDFPALILEEVRRLRMQDQVVFGLRTLEQVRALRRIAPNAVILGFFRHYDAYPAFFAAGGDIARLWEEDVSEGNLELARGPIGVGGARPVWVTAGLRSAGEAAGDIDGARLQGLMEKGIDGILVNDPARALRARGEFERRTRAGLSGGRGGEAS